jgi:hypothetical protein
MKTSACDTEVRVPIGLVVQDLFVINSCQEWLSRCSIVRIQFSVDERLASPYNNMY